MRVSLNQDEILEAVFEYVTSKLSLPADVGGEITFIAGRSPRGVSAEVELSYPTASTSPSKWVAAADDKSDQPVDDVPTATTEDQSEPKAEGEQVPVSVPSANNIFG